MYPKVSIHFTNVLTVNESFDVSKTFLVERQREKRLLNDEINDLRRERDQLSMENSRKSNQVEQVSTRKDNAELQLLNAEDSIRMLRNQVVSAQAGFQG